MVSKKNISKWFQGICLAIFVATSTMVYGYASVVLLGMVTGYHPYDLEILMLFVVLFCLVIGLRIVVHWAVSQKFRNKIKRNAGWLIGTKGPPRIIPWLFGEHSHPYSGPVRILGCGFLTVGVFVFSASARFHYRGRFTGFEIPEGEAIVGLLLLICSYVFAASITLASNLNRSNLGG